MDVNKWPIEKRIARIERLLASQADQTHRLYQKIYAVTKNRRLSAAARRARSQAIISASILSQRLKRYGPLMIALGREFSRTGKYNGRHLVFFSRKESAKLRNFLNTDYRAFNGLRGRRHD